MARPYFSDGEYAARLAAVRRHMADRDVETLLLSDRAAVIREANQLRISAELKNEPLWRGRLEWLLARARLEDSRAMQAAGGRLPEADIARCAELHHRHHCHLLSVVLSGRGLCAA